MSNFARTYFIPKRKLKRLLVFFCCLLGCILPVTWYIASSIPLRSIHTNSKLTLYTNFTIVVPILEPKLRTRQDKHFFLVVVVNSDATGEKHRLLRQTIRHTWGNSTSHHIPVPVLQHPKWKVFFTLGISRNPGDHQLNLQEASQNNDVIIGNLTDRYTNLVHKTLMSHHWVSTRISCDYIFKTDDDVYVRVPKLINWLQKVGFPKPFYGGLIHWNRKVSRGNDRWRLTREEYSEDNFPPFCYGAFHVISTDTIPKILSYTTITRPFHTDDAYLAVALDYYGVNAINIPGFNFKHPFIERTDEELICATALGHNIDVSIMLKYKAFYQKRKNFLIEQSSVFKCNH